MAVAANFSLERQFGDAPIKEYKLYGGKVVLKYDDQNHLYFIDSAEQGRVIVPNVTSIIKIIDKSQVLVPWAVKMMADYLRDKLNVPFESPSSSLIQPLTQQGMDKLIEEAKRAHRNYTKQAADIGKMAHGWLEKYGRLRVQGLLHDNAVTQTSNQYPLKDEKAVNCVRAALQWIVEHHVEPITVERKVYSMLYGYTGTMDWKGMVDGKLSVLDFKSSKGIYDEYRLQTAAYKEADEEETGRKLEQRVLLKLGKEDGDFEALILADEEEYWADLQAFKGSLLVYERLQELREQSKKAKQLVREEKKKITKRATGLIEVENTVEV